MPVYNLKNIVDKIPDINIFSKKLTDEIIKEIISSEQKIYEYDEAYQEKYLKAKPWDKDDTHFKKYTLVL